jgi:hypothetical protein
LKGKSRLLAALLGLLFLLSPLWPLGLLFFLYLLVSLRPRVSRKAGDSPGARRVVSRRLVLGLLLISFSAIALASGGTLSVAVFFVLGVTALLWPSVARRLSLSEVVPLGDSILLRSKYLPHRWYALAEVKQGQEQFPRAISSFEGTLLVFTDTGRAYSVVACNALARKEAETKLLASFRSAASIGRAGAYLLPLDSVDAADVLRHRTPPARFPSNDIADSASRFSGLLLLECRRGFATRASAFEVGPAGPPTLPGDTRELASPPLLWEVIDAVGKRTKWPDPDQYSILLDSLVATRGVPLGERLKELEGDGGKLRVQALSGPEVRTSRPQLRAIISIYS